MIRVVLDTNIVIRALIKPDGSVGPVLRRLLAGEYELVSSESLLVELAEKLALPRIRVKYHLEQSSVEEFIAFIAGECDVETPQDHIDVCRDPGDNMVLEAAVAGHADYIVTGDEDLLVMGSYEGIGIVTARKFLARLDDQRR